MRARLPAASRPKQAKDGQVLDQTANHTRALDRDRLFGGPRRSDAAEAVRELERHFRDNYPILLDGALPLPGDRGHFVRQARETLARGPVDPSQLPAAVLRETLESVTAAPRPATRAGLTAIGPRHARVWWDDAVAEDFPDILANLDKPRLALRFYDVTGLDPDAGRWHGSFDIDVNLEERGRTAELWNSGRAFVVELGYIHSDGRFLCLARTNSAALPRDGAADATTGIATVFSRLSPRDRGPDRMLTPDARARDWAAVRPDHAARDLEAEYLIHMLYRAFLREGPRALRRAAAPRRRDPELLGREYGERSRSRRAAPKRVKKAAPSVIVTRLDRRPRALFARAESVFASPAPLTGIARLAAGGSVTAGEYALLLAAVANARTGRPSRFAPKAAGGETASPAPEMLPPRASELVMPVPADAPASATLLATPVFEAARELRRRLAGIPPAPAAESPKPAAESRRNRVFGGAEARRFAKAGVRITRMALTLEGRVRPGARLKVAGKLVHADADGRFSLECVLSGRKAAIPLRAGASIGGEARSLINVEWEKRASRDKKKTV